MGPACPGPRLAEYCLGFTFNQSDAFSLRFQRCTLQALRDQFNWGDSFSDYEMRYDKNESDNRRSSYSKAEVQHELPFLFSRVVIYLRTRNCHK